MTLKTCQKICKECPFTGNSSPGWLGLHEGPEQLHNVVMYELPFPCHMVHQNDDVVIFDVVGSKNFPLCRGALLYMKKAGKVPRNTDLNKAVTSVPEDECNLVFTVPQFFKHHTIYNLTGNED